MYCVVRQRHSRPEKYDEGDRCAILLRIYQELVLLRVQHHGCHDGCSDTGLCLAFPLLDDKFGCFVGGWDVCLLFGAYKPLSQL